MKIPSFEEKYRSIVFYFNLSKMDCIHIFKVSRDVLDEWYMGRKVPVKMSYNYRKVNILYKVINKVDRKGVALFHNYTETLFKYLEKDVILYPVVKYLTKVASRRSITRKNNMDLRRASEHHIEKTKEEQDEILETNLLLL